MHIKDFPEIHKLSMPEKILLVEDLWDSIIAEDHELAVPESHKRELNRRLNEYGAAPGRLLSLDELRVRIAKKK